MPADPAEFRGIHAGESVQTRAIRGDTPCAPEGTSGTPLRVRFLPSFIPKRGKEEWFGQGSAQLEFRLDNPTAIPPHPLSFLATANHIRVAEPPPLSTQ